LPLQEAPLDAFACAFRSEAIGRSRIIHADCFEWLAAIPQNSVHAIITDPPYGVKEYDTGQFAKRATGSGGVWGAFRPPSMAICERRCHASQR
jgi:site-specific DNA-methyltransferase (adenine-specific)